jgi:hypothetical protein
MLTTMTIPISEIEDNCIMLDDAFLTGVRWAFRRKGHGIRHIEFSLKDVKSIRRQFARRSDPSEVELSIVKGLDKFINLDYVADPTLVVYMG